MQNKKETKSRQLRVDMTPTEISRLRAEWKTTTIVTFSEYIRTRLRQTPIVLKYRNQSLDDLYEALAQIKGEAERIAREIGAGIDKIMQSSKQEVSIDTIQFLLAEQFAAKTGIEQIKTLLTKIYNQCVQEEKKSPS